MKPLQMTMPTDTKCEVCSRELRVMPFPGLHHLCPECGKKVQAKINPLIDNIIQELKAGIVQ